MRPVEWIERPDGSSIPISRKSSCFATTEIQFYDGITIWLIGCRWHLDASDSKMMSVIGYW